MIVLIAADFIFGIALSQFFAWFILFPAGAAFFILVLAFVDGSIPARMVAFGVLAVGLQFGYVTGLAVPLWIDALQAKAPAQRRQRAEGGRSMIVVRLLVARSESRRRLAATAPPARPHVTAYAVVDRPALHASIPARECQSIEYKPALGDCVFRSESADGFAIEEPRQAADLTVADRAK